MAIELIITNVFHLLDGTTVLAFEGGDDGTILAGQQATLKSNGETRQNFSIAGERLMLNKHSRKNERALETRDQLSITLEEAQSRSLRLVLS